MRIFRFNAMLFLNIRLSELFELRTSIVRAVIRNWLATSCRTSGRRAERRVHCEPKRSREKIAPDKKREKEWTGDGESYILRSFVRPFIRSYRSFLFAATPYCQVAYTRRLLSVSSWRARVRDATYPRVCTRSRRRRHQSRRSHAFSASVRVAISLRVGGKTMSRTCSSHSPAAGTDERSWKYVSRQEMHLAL